MPRAVALAMVMLVALAAGCTAPTEAPGASTTDPSTGTPTSTSETSTTPTSTLEPVAGTMDITGLVADEALVPIPLANVTMPGLGLVATTDAQGRYRFEDVARGAWLMEARAAGFANGTVFVSSTGNATEVADFILAPLPTDVPYQDATVRYEGFLECAHEAVIFSGPCDLLLRFGGQSVFSNTSSFSFPVDDRWATVVLDLHFDPADQPLLEGLRMTVRGQGAANQLGTYDQYGRFYDSKPFSVHLAPDEQYEDGTAGPVPGNLTAFQVEVYPHAPGYHAACVPETPVRPAECALGAGAGINVQFELAVTVFYIEAAPAGFTALPS